MTKLADGNETGIVIPQPVGATVQIVVDTLFARIKSEEYPRDTRLPSERTLAAELGVDTAAVQKVLEGHVRAHLDALADLRIEL